MRVSLTPFDSSDQLEDGYQITPLSPYFTDWRGGEASLNERENRDDEIPLDRLTMEMINRGDLDQETSIGADRHAYSHLVDCDTSNATTIFWQDWPDHGDWPADYVPTNKRAYYRQLDRYNSGLQNGPNRQNKSYNTFKMNRALIECMSEPLRLEGWQIKRATHLFDGLQRSNTGRLSRVVAFCTCAYVVHNFDDRRKCHPQMGVENRDTYFEEVREDYNISRKHFNRAYGQIAGRIRSGDLESKRHDAYETDGASHQSWRSPVDGDEGWL